MWETSGENLLNPQSDVVLSNVIFIEGEAKLFSINLSSIHHWLRGRRIVWCVVGIGHTVPWTVSRVHHLIWPSGGFPSQSGPFCGDGKDTLPGCAAWLAQKSNTITLVLNSTLLLIGYAREELCVHAPKRAPGCATLSGIPGRLRLFRLRTSLKYMSGFYHQ